MAKYGPGRAEWRFRLIASLCGLGAMIGALAYRGIPTGPAFVEVVGIAGLFFGGTAVLSLINLRKSDRD